MQTIYNLPLILEPQPEGGYTVACPILPELITEGDSIQEAFANASDALPAITEAYEDLERPLPPALQRLTIDTPISIETLVPVG
ncbi:MAG: type II toxin-antitoxin system HicB family antitoxin [candidate division KSB1 bacterium]|nr:type II toxin-antitoxin system HicB family antitoxin [candidate division KSB1 bacterium]MDZ7368245.1 type II toxin-antitoxin system HicB family antitoxin [candidate division KSB1 bacterium]MDZ7406773.1 type II toxin-antitoxin system HicB family antitoxin [candidate division KSB1 bacterium]